MKYKTEISRRNYKAGYVVIKGIQDGKEYDMEDFEMSHAETPAGDYIGNSKDAYRICKKMGIRPETRTDQSRTCSIGWCDKEQKWYGWSHRAIYGFGVGSEVKPGDCAYTPTDKEDFRLDSIRFWSDGDRESVSGKWAVDEDGLDFVSVTFNRGQNIPNKKLRGEIVNLRSYPPKTWGNGEWTAKTFEDAKQMACDFAEGVG